MHISLLFFCHFCALPLYLSVQMMPNIIIQTLIYDVYVIIVNLDNLL